MIAPFDMPVAYTRFSSTLTTFARSSSSALMKATSSTPCCMA
jgi:hypothetical protein